jgi:2-oxoglutarate/2-oxoacid ferredoxin oxidoreductase subunit alpha
LLNARGARACYWHLTDVWPFPAEAVRETLGGASRPIVVEQNATGQLARLIAQETGILVASHVRKYDGRPLSPEEIVRGVKEVFPDA